MDGGKRLQLRDTGGKSRLGQGSARKRQNFPALHLHHTGTVQVKSVRFFNPLSTLLKGKTLIKLFHCNPTGSKITPDQNLYDTIYSLSHFSVNIHFLLQKKQSLNKGSCPTSHWRICVTVNINVCH